MSAERRLPAEARLFLALQLGLGLGWLAVLPLLADSDAGISAPAGAIRLMLFGAGWLPSVAVACWQSRHLRWPALLISDLVFTLGLSVVAFTLYVPLFFTMVIWFVLFAMLPRGCVARLMQISLHRMKPPLERGR